MGIFFAILFLVSLLGWVACAVALCSWFVGNLAVSVVAPFIGAWMIGLRAETNHWPIISVATLLFLSAVIGRVWGHLGLGLYLTLLSLMIASSALALFRVLRLERNEESIING